MRLLKPPVSVPLMPPTAAAPASEEWVTPLPPLTTLLSMLSKGEPPTTLELAPPSPRPAAAAAAAASSGREERRLLLMPEPSHASPGLSPSLPLGLVTRGGVRLPWREG